jgi:hypothetical protein
LLAVEEFERPSIAELLLYGHTRPPDRHHPAFWSGVGTEAGCLLASLAGNRRQQLALALDPRLGLFFAPGPSRKGPPRGAPLRNKNLGKSGR